MRDWRVGTLCLMTLWSWYVMFNDCVPKVVEFWDNQLDLNVFPSGCCC